MAPMRCLRQWCPQASPQSWVFASESLLPRPPQVRGQWCPVSGCWWAPTAANGAAAGSCPHRAGSRRQGRRRTGSSIPGRHPLPQWPALGCRPPRRAAARGDRCVVATRPGRPRGHRRPWHLRPRCDIAHRCCSGRHRSRPAVRSARLRRRRVPARSARPRAQPTRQRPLRARPRSRVTRPKEAAMPAGVHKQCIS